MKVKFLVLPLVELFVINLQVSEKIFNLGRLQLSKNEA